MGVASVGCVARSSTTGAGLFFPLKVDIDRPSVTGECDFTVGAEVVLDVATLAGNVLGWNVTIGAVAAHFLIPSFLYGLPHQLGAGQRSGDAHEGRFG